MSSGMAYFIIKKDDDGPRTLAMQRKGFGRPCGKAGWEGTIVVKGAGR
jgi:hypothetical protein